MHICLYLVSVSEIRSIKYDKKKKKTKEEIIPVGCVPPASVATTRCQYRVADEYVCGMGIPEEG